MRLLIATVTAGAGHLQAAAALEEAWRAWRPGDVVERVDVLAFTSKLFRRAYAQGYVQLVERAPELYGLLFRKADNPKRLRKLTKVRRALARMPTERFVKYVRNFQPDAVCCTHFMPPEVLGAMRAKSQGAPGPMIITVVTDFEAHALWMEPSVDLYCVAAEETKARLVARGLAPENVRVTGIPVSGRFATAVDAPAVRKRMGLRDDLPILLVLSGGFGMGPVGEILRELDKLATSIQTVVVCGKNEKLRRALAMGDCRHPTHVLGFVNNMQELMAVSALIISKPGGLTTAEALAMGKPLLVLNPIPGQEAANSDFLLEHGAAVKINRVEDLPSKLERLLDSPKLAALGRAARELGRPQAALAICRAAVERFEAVASNQET